MVVISLTNCPANLRGDLTLWLLEIDPGVYVGNISARVRDNLWERIVENLKNGRAILVYTSNTEQGLKFKVHNSYWKTVEYDGLDLILRPKVHEATEKILNSNFSKASQIIKAKQYQKNDDIYSTILDNYVVLDTETTGTNIGSDKLIEVAVLKIKDHKIVDDMTYLIKIDQNLPANIERLTGITNRMIQSYGKEEEFVIREIMTFIGKDTVVAHNTLFDYKFLNYSAKKYGIELLNNPFLDTLRLSRKFIRNTRDYKLSSIAEALNIDIEQSHRAYDDCLTTYKIYEKITSKYFK